MDINALKKCMRGQSQADIAAALNISQQRLNNYVNGKREPDHDMLQKIADHFDVSVDYLLGRDKNKKPAAYGGELVEGFSEGVEIMPEKVLDERLIEMLIGLAPDDVRLVEAFVEGLRAKKR